MNEWREVRLADVAPVPWRNGGGTTRELLAWPSAGDWVVRLSVAEVASDGPFSKFDGIERWFAVLQGAGVRLTIDGVAHEVRRDSAPLRFDGGAAVQANLIDGPTLDFNLMAPPGTATLTRSGAELHVAAKQIEARYDIGSATLRWRSKL